MDEYGILFNIEPKDEAKIREINCNHLSHLSFKHSSYAGLHIWNFKSQEDALKAKKIIQKNCPEARDKA